MKTWNSEFSENSELALWPSKVVQTLTQSFGRMSGLSLQPLFRSSAKRVAFARVQNGPHGCHSDQQSDAEIIIDEINRPVVQHVICLCTI